MGEETGGKIVFMPLVITMASIHMKKGMEYIKILQMIVSLASKLSAIPCNYYDHIKKIMTT